MAGITAFLLCLYCFTLSKMDFNFANDGKMICVTKKDFGFLSTGKVTCFGIVNPTSSLDQLMMTVNNFDKNGEVVLKVK